ERRQVAEVDRERVETLGMIGIEAFRDLVHLSRDARHVPAASKKPRRDCEPDPAASARDDDPPRLAESGLFVRRGGEAWNGSRAHSALTLAIVCFHRFRAHSA